VGGEALKTVVKKRQDFGSTEGCAQRTKNNFLQSSKEKSNMIIELLQTLSMEDQDSQTPECLSTVLCSFLHAHDKVSEIIVSFSDDIVCCNPLDNMITALTQHPARITNKWRLEFTRWCDWSRILTVTPGTNFRNSVF